MKKLVAAAAISVLPLAARADQCAHVARDKATAALKLLKSGKMATHFCQPCGEKDPTRPFKIGKSVVRPSAGLPDQFEVLLDGHGVDLAYTYVDQGKGVFVNVADKVGCRAEEVSLTLKQEAKGAFTIAPRPAPPMPLDSDGPKEILPPDPGGQIALDARPTAAAGTLDPEAVVATIRLRKGGVIACYEHALRKKKDLGGKIELHFTIEKTGVVSGAAVDSDTVGDPAMAKCVTAIVRSWRFPSSSEQLVFAFPFTFEKDSDHDGVADHRDKCPKHREDHDGHGDHDGCPE